MEIVAEADLDFENFKKRAEFREQFGGDGVLYGRPDDDLSSRPGTPSTFTTFTDLPYARHHSPRASSSRASSRTRFGDAEEGTEYAKGYTRPDDEGFEDVGINVPISQTPLDAREMLRGTSSRTPLVSGEHGGYFEGEDTSYEQFRRGKL
jgi:hypothetical protein